MELQSDFQAGDGIFTFIVCFILAAFSFLGIFISIILLCSKKRRQIWRKENEEIFVR